MAEIVHLREGIPIFASGAVEGFDAATYGALFYLLGEHLINSDRPSYFPLRLLSVVGILVCAFGCGLLAYWLTHSHVAAFLSPLVFVSYGMVTGHAIQALSDSVALALSWTGFLVAFRLRAHRGCLLLAAFIMMVGFFYKPQFVAAQLAVFAFLLLERRYKEAAQFASMLVACALVMFSLFQWITFSGQGFWRHFLVYQSALLSWHRFGQALFVFAIMLFLPVLLGWEYFRAYPDNLLRSYLFFSLLLGLVFYSKEGSGVHYFLESVLVLSVVVPAFLARRVRLGTPPVDLVLLLGIMLFAGQWSTKRAPQRSDFAHYQAIQSFLEQNFPRHARALGTAPGDLLQAGLETPFSGLFQLVRLAGRGIVSDSHLAAQIKARRFSVVVLNFDLRREQDPYWLNFYLSPPLVEALQRNYELADSLDLPGPAKERPEDRCYLYVPRRNP